tara:strand:+ start:1395 stop:1823 length:429 start_codon:yes stop_codon:yes gene_type:complete
MSKESDYIINQINQAPKDFRGDESDFIIDKIKTLASDPDIKKLKNHFENVNSTMANAFNALEIPFMMVNQVYELTGGNLKESKKIITDIDKIIKANPDYDKYAEGDYQQDWDSIVNRILNEESNPFTEGLPQSDTMMPKDFR